MTKHKIGLISLTMIGVSTMVGSGWLFSAYYTAKIAGPGAFFSWGLAGLIILVLGLCLAEIATIHPKIGLMARLLLLSHNKEFAFICTMATWLGLTAVIATEVVSTLQYLSHLTWFGSYIFNPTSHQLTFYGIIIGTIMLAIFFLFNFWGIGFLAKSNVVLTVFKIIVPLATAVTIIFAAFHSSNFTSYHHTLMPYSSSSIFTAIINAGLIYSFNGFQNVASFAGEVRRPERNIPLAMLISIVMAFSLYVLLQVAFIGAMKPEDIANGWHHLDFTSPFVEITSLLGLHAITLILYADSVVSPSATGLVYAGSTTRLLTAMSQEKQMPGYFAELNMYHFNRRSLFFTLLFALGFLLAFRSWSSLVPLLSLFYLISYMAIPLCLGKLRQKKQVGVFKIPLAGLVSPLLLIFISLFYVYSKFPNTAYVAVLMSVFYLLHLCVVAKRRRIPLITVAKNSILLMVYLLVLAIISAMGPVEFGGYGLLSNITLGILAAVTSVITYLISTYGEFLVTSQ